MWPRALLGKTPFRFRCRVALRTEAVLKTRILRFFLARSLFFVKTVATPVFR